MNTLCTICKRKEKTIYNFIQYDRYRSKTQQFIGDFEIYCNSKNTAFEIVDKLLFLGGI